MLILLWLFAGSLLGAGYLLSSLARRRAEAAKQWPKVVGRVAGSDVRDNGNGTYSPEVSYVYEVAGKAYASDRLRPGGSPLFHSMAKAATVAAAYPPDSIVTVYHPPGKPQAAAIECEPMSQGALILWIFAAIAFAVAALVTVMP
jgi:hypothetical protein